MRDDDQPSNLTPKGWSNPPTLKDLKQDLENANKAHKQQCNKIERWLDYLHVEGEAKVNPPKGSSAVQPKLIRKQAEWRYAALSEPFLSAENLFDVKPVTWEDVESARQNKLILNHQFNTKLDKVKFIDEYVRTVVDEGTAIVKVNWDFEEEEVVETVPQLDFIPAPQMAEQFAQLDQLEAENPNAYRQQVPEELQQAHAVAKQTGAAVAPITVGMQEVTRFKTLRNAPSLEVCDFRNVVIDPSSQGDMNKAKFVVYRFETNLSELKKDGKYQNLDYIDINTNNPSSDQDYETNSDPDFDFSDNPRKRIIAHEYWGYHDFDGSGIARPIVATWVGNVLIRLEENPYPDRGLPFVVVSLLPVRNSVYGEPDGSLLIENQKIIGAVTRGMIDIMGKSANGQTGVRKDALDATNLRKFNQGKDYQFNASVDPRMAFYMHTYPEIPQSAQYMLNLQNMDAESMTGVKAFASTGISSDALGEVATGIKGALDATSTRQSGILRRLAKGVSDIGRKIIALNQELLDDEEIIRITNEDFVAVQREALAGDVDLVVDITSLDEDNVKAQELAFMLQTMGPSGDPAIAMKILTKIARLRKMPDLAKEFEEYEPQPDPIQEQLQQLELQKAQLELQKLQAEIAAKYADAELDKAKAAKEQSATDQANLDFVEQETGVTQERNKELQGVQAKANMQLEREKFALQEQSKANDRQHENEKGFLEYLAGGKKQQQ